VKTPPAIAVLLAEDHQVVREGLRRLLELEPDIEVIGEAPNGRQAVDMTLALRPQVVVMDIAMPKVNGLEATRRIREAAPEVKVLILSAHCDDAYVERVKELGAAGYLVKQTSAHTLVEAVREVARENSFYSSSIARRYARRHRMGLNRRGVARMKNVRLSARESEVLQRIAEGGANKQIADELGISIKTVEKHRDHLMRKLDIHDIAGLTRYAIATGIVEGNIPVTFE